jgi:GPH family glycoside/pentoside/hexuronide:cation symporter
MKDEGEYHGYWSDHLHSRWGRRLPLIFSASLPLVIVFVLLWLPPIKGMSIINLFYLGLMLILFNVAQALVIIPLGSLLPELAALDKHRPSDHVGSHLNLGDRSRTGGAVN